MLNHVRTLLLNKKSSSELVDALGGELISLDFIPVQEHSAVQLAKSVLFGSDPDPLTLNYRAFQYMQLLHADPIARSYLVTNDSRITHLNDNDVWLTYPFKEEFREVRDEGTNVLTLTGRTLSSLADDDLGHNRVVAIIQREHTNAIDISGAVKIINYSSGTLHKYIHNNQGIPGRLALQGEFNGFVLTLTGAGTTDPDWIIPTTAGQLSDWSNYMDASGGTDVSLTYQLSAIVKPTRSLVSIDSALSDKSIYQSNFNAPNIEPYTTFSNMMRSNESPLRRLCGLLLMCSARNGLSNG